MHIEIAVAHGQKPSGQIDEGLQLRVFRVKSNRGRAAIAKRYRKKAMAKQPPSIRCARYRTDDRFGLLSAQELLGVPEQQRKGFPILGQIVHDETAVNAEMIAGAHDEIFERARIAGRREYDVVRIGSGTKSPVQIASVADRNHGIFSIGAKPKLIEALVKGIDSFNFGIGCGR